MSIVCIKDNIIIIISSIFHSIIINLIIRCAHTHTFRACLSLKIYWKEIVINITCHYACWLPLQWRLIDIFFVNKGHIAATNITYNTQAFLPHGVSHSIIIKAFIAIAIVYIYNMVILHMPLRLLVYYTILSLSRHWRLHGMSRISHTHTHIVIGTMA